MHHTLWHLVSTMKNLIPIWFLSLVGSDFLLSENFLEFKFILGDFIRLAFCLLVCLYIPYAGHTVGIFNVGTHSPDLQFGNQFYFSHCWCDNFPLSFSPSSLSETLNRSDIGPPEWIFFFCCCSGFHLWWSNFFVLGFKFFLFKFSLVNVQCNIGFWSIIQHFITYIVMVNFFCNNLPKLQHSVI